MSDDTPRSAPPEEETAPPEEETAPPEEETAPPAAKTAPPEDETPPPGQPPGGGDGDPTPPDPAPPELASIESRAGEARDRFEELLRARRTTRLVRYLVLFVFLGVFFGWIYVFYATIDAFDMNEFEQEMQGRSERIFTRVSETLFDVVTEVRPAYAMAIARELEKSGPVIGDRIDTEVKILEGNVQLALQKRLDAGLKRVAEEQRAALRAAFPELADNPKAIDRMMVTIQEGLRTWVSKELTTTLHEHVDALLDIKETLAAFRPDDPNREVDPEEMLSVWLELVYERMGGDEALEVTPPTTPATKAPRR